MGRSVVLVVVLTVLAALAVTARAGEGPRRVVYVSALDADGAPITDLTPDDFAIKEGGKTCSVVSVEPAAARMTIAIVVDDNGTGIFRTGVARFIERLLGRAEFAISIVRGQPVKLVDYTTDTDALRSAVAQLAARSATPDGGQLLDGIYDSAKTMERERSARGVILALTVGGEEHSPVSADEVFDQLRKSGAALHVVAMPVSTSRSTVPVTRSSQLLGENLNLGEILGDGPQQTGGSRIDIVATAGLVTELQHLADALAHQYAITYALPDGAKRSDRVNVSVKRGGVKLRAPSRVAK